MDDQSSKIEVLTLALKKTKDKLIHWTLMPDQDGDTSIHLAVIREDNVLSLYLCRLLASSGYSLDIRNKLMQTPLHLSCILGNLKLFRKLLELEAAKVECADRHGNSCVHLAVKHDDETCELLHIIVDHLRKKEDGRDIINAKNIHGYSALHIASSINKPEAIRLLVEGRAEINQPDTKCGKSPLYIAVEKRNREAAQALLELGADANKLTYFRDSPSQLASNQNRRSLLRLISRYDTSSQAQTPEAGCRRNTRRERGMVNQGDCDSDTNHENEQDKTRQKMKEQKTILGKLSAGMSATDGAPLVDGSNSVRRITVTNSPSGSEQTCRTGCVAMTKFVKRENVSPADETEPAYPMPDSNSPQRGEHVETAVSHTIPDCQTVDNVRTAREQFLLTSGSLLHVLSPAVMAASVYNQQERVGKPGLWRPISPLVTGQLQRFGIPHTHGVRGDQIPNDSRHIRKPPTTVCMTSQSVRGTERSCVRDDESPVSKRNPRGTTTNSQPLDLSQSKDEDAEMNNTSVNMLIDGEMSAECGSGKTQKETPERETDEYIQRRVKQEVVENDPATVQHCETTQHSEYFRSLPTEQTASSNASLHLANFRNGQNLMDAFIPFTSPWVNFPATILNPAFLPQAYSGYIPSALASAQTHPGLMYIDPSTLSQRNYCLSQWVNLSMDAARAVAVTANENQNSRKRKLADSIQNRESESKEILPNREHAMSDTEETTKRLRAQEIPDGLHPTVSDDPGNGKLKDQDSSKSKLRRSNSAPAIGLVPQVLQEGQKKVAPVDLLSYRGCLPPHYLHLLRASGNLVTETENTLRDVEKVVHPIRHVDKITSANDRQSTRISSNVLQRSVPSQRNVVSAYRAKYDDFSEAARSVLSPRLLKKTNFSHRREFFSPSKHNEPADQLCKISCTASVPIFPKAIHRGRHQNHEIGSSYRKYSLNPVGFPENVRRRTSDKTRANSETDSDDNDHIEMLQISDASSDEDEEEIAISRHRLTDGRRSLLGSARNTKRMGAIEFGKASWTDLDTGKLPAFGGNTAVPDINRTTNYSDRIYTEYTSTPTKMASSISRNFPRALNGLPRVYCTSKIFATERKVDRRAKALAQEFASHDIITAPRKQFEIKDLKLPTKQSLDDIKKHTCNGCSWLNSRSKQDEHRLKLIGDILQAPLNAVSSPNGYHRTTPRCTPRLVFTSEIKLPSEVEHRKKLTTESTVVNKFCQAKAVSGVEALRHTEKVQTLSAMYSRKPFGFARTTKETKNNNLSVAQSVVSGRKVSLYASEGGERPSILSGCTVPASRTKTNSSTSTRLSSLDAKLEELRQKATEREEQRSEGTSNRTELTNEMQADSGSMKSEVISENERASYSPNASLNTVQKRCTSPFYENDSSRFVGKRNIAVIKPNQSVSGAVNNEDGVSGYACPPKKRHVKRYSPEFYAKPKPDTPQQDGEVRSASPLPHPPFVSTNVLINNDDHSLNVRWCSPERSPNGRKLHGSNSRTILTYRVPLGQMVRGRNSHTVTLERNYLEYPRCVASPRSDAVIVVESRLMESAGDQKEERLEIEDLEISDDET